MKLRFTFFLLAGVLNALPVLSQSPAFEVASVKVNKSNNGVAGGCRGIDTKPIPGDRVQAPLGRCVITSARLSHLIPIAYGIQLQNVKGGPEFVWGVDRFDIEGKAENPSTATEKQLRSMLQNLLVDRFSLKFHLETKQVNGYALVIAKNGPKLKEAAGDGRPSLRMTGAEIFKGDAIEQKNLTQNTILGQQLSMARLAEVFSNLPDGSPVIDKTGLDGLYDFKLSWEPGESLSSVLQEQLGLRLEAQKVPIDMLIIDSAVKPAEN